ncbi:9108_t:CDS:2, partial [Funneliformis mosseae]
DTFLNMKEELNIQNKDSEVLLNIQDKKFKELLTYDSAEDFSDADSKVFQNWNHASKFMKKYVAIKGYRIRIGGSKRIDKTAFTENQRLNASSCRVECLWKHIGHKFYSSAVRFVPLLCKLLEKVIQEIHFLTVIAKANATIHKFHCEVTPGEADTEILLRRLYDKKTEDLR